MTEKIKLADYFGVNLAELLAEKIVIVYPEFDESSFIASVQAEYREKTLTQRVTLIAEALHRFLPRDYPHAIDILVSIMGEENPHETGMFTHFYWLMPVGKYIELY